MFGRRKKALARGQRVFLYAPSRDAGQEFVAMTQANESYHRPWVYPPTDLRRYRAYLDRVTAGRTCGFLVALNEDDRLIGVININDIIGGGFKSGSLGYYVDMSVAGNGYMAEALALVLDQAFTVLGLHRLESNVQPANAASLALIRKLGFRKEGFSPKFLQIDGIWRDHERWAILDEEWFAATGQG